MKVILITQRIDYLEDRNEWRDSTDRELINFVSQAGYCPIVLPNWIYRDGIDLSWLFGRLDPAGFILTGGNDIGQYEYRDKLEYEIIEWSVLKNVPILGICRGMQLINLFFDGTIVRMDGHVKTTHKVFSTENKAHQVNSYHNFVIKDLGKGMKPTFLADDNTVEGFRHSSLPCFGIMWHPERSGGDKNLDFTLIRSIFR